MELLKEALSKIDRPGVFCTYGNTPYIMPGLQVSGVGDVGLPLQKEQAEKIREKARRAPFGKGMDTIVDLNVRNVWEIDQAEVVIANPAWEKMLNSITAGIAEALGVTKAISHHLYKLLLYEKGSFFLPHKDTEKEDRMFASMTITLPSFHRGGDLAISHEGETAYYSFDKKEDLYNIQYAAFYADCMHEVKPVTEGYRLTLIYNLTFSGEEDMLKAPNNQQYLQDFITGMEQLRDEPLKKFIVPLEHEYTEKNLSFQNLKNLDHAKTELLVKAARQANFMIYLAFIHHRESGIPTDDEYEMEEVYDEDTYIDHWVSVYGKEMSFGRFPLKTEEFVLHFNFHDDEPYRQDYEGYAGNYGPSLDQVYRRAALVFWPKEQHFLLLAEKGQAAAIPALKEYFDRYVASHDEKLREECKQFAAVIMTYWQRQTYGRSHATHKPMLETLLGLGDPGLVSSFIERVLFFEVSGDEGPLLTRAATKWGWSLLNGVREVPKKLQEDNSLPLTQLLQAFCTGDKTTEKVQFCYAFFQETTAHILLGKPARGFDSTRKRETLGAICAAASWFGETELAAPFFDHILQKEANWSLDEVVLPFLLDALAEGKLRTTPQAVQSLAHRVKNVLDTDLSVPISDPVDWVQDVKLSCACADCHELQAFVLHPSENVHHFRVNKDRRQHLHQQIDRAGLDMTHVTSRSGSPQTLVCTKTRNTWEKLKEQRKYRENCYQEIVENQ